MSVSTLLLIKDLHVCYLLNHYKAPRRSVLSRFHYSYVIEEATDMKIKAKGSSMKREK